LGWDRLFWVIAVPVAVALRFDNQVSKEMFEMAAKLGVILGLLQIFLRYSVQAVHRRDIENVFTGLRQGEKLEEALISVFETAEYRKHPLIAHIRLSPEKLSIP